MGLTADERRKLAGELADDLVARGATLLDVERLAPLLVDRVRLTVRGPSGGRRGADRPAPVAPRDGGVGA